MPRRYFTVRSRTVVDQPYFDQSGEPSDASPRFVRVDDLDPLVVIPGLEFGP